MACKKITLSLLVGLLTSAGWAQMQLSDTLVHLADVEVHAARIDRFAVGVSLQKFDSATLQVYTHQSLADLLATQAGLNIKSYGLGGLSSLSMRGGGAQHTAVLWNGINLQSPMHGGVNLSVFPVAMFQNIQVQHGGSGTLFGSGAMTGAVHLGNTNMLGKDDYTHFSGSVGSFGNRQMNFATHQSGEQWAASLKVMTQAAHNKFDYYNTAQSYTDPPLVQQTHAAVSQYGVMQENQWQIHANGRLSTAVWYHHQDKELQTTMLNAGHNPSQATQKETNLLTSVRYKQLWGAYSLHVKNAAIFNGVLYQNPAASGADAYANNRALSLSTEVENRWLIGQYQTLNMGAQLTREQGQSQGYENQARRHQVALFASYKWQGLLSKRLDAVVSARSGYAGKQWMPLVYSLGAEFRAMPWLALFGNASKNYRLPTFNDLHWRTTAFASGNPDLVPESGASAEAGLKQQFRSGDLQWQLSQNAYYSHINQWIVWLPMPEAEGRWMPENKQTGTSYGSEWKIRCQWQQGRSQLTLTSFYTYTRARLASNDAYHDKQKVYVPKHQWAASANWQRKGLHAGFQVNYQGPRYYDHTHQLPAYTLGRAHLGYSWQWPAGTLNARLAIHNLWNTPYQVMAWYAMPLRHYELTLGFRL